MTSDDIAASIRRQEAIIYISISGRYKIKLIYVQIVYSLF